MKSSIDLIIATVQILLFLGVPAGIFVAVAVMRHRERSRVLDLVREAAAQERPLSAEVVQALTGRTVRPPGRRDFRRGAVLVAVGVGLALIGLCAGFGVSSTGLRGGAAVALGILALAAMPLCIGAALIVLSRSEGR